MAQYVIDFFFLEVEILNCTPYPQLTKTLIFFFLFERVPHDLGRHGFSTTREPMAAYGDPAYLLRVHLQVPYRGARIAPQIELYNKESKSLLYNVRF